MQVFLEAIKFNHDPESANCDAFNIRKNETESVHVPEWRRKEAEASNQPPLVPQQSPAAYAIKELGKNVITIKAKFTCDNSTVKGVEIRALNLPENDTTIHSNYSDEAIVSTVLPPRPRRNNVLGWIPPQPITFSENGEVLNLQDSKISQAGVGVHVIHWQWQFRLNSKDSWKDIEKTCHKIYTVPCLPKRPWLQKPYAPDNIQLPWTDVLDYACHWAKGAHETDDAAVCVTQSVRDLEKVFYITYDPSPFYSHPNFDCTAFIKLIKDGIGKGSRLNCSDCATAVSSFANILGCTLWQSTMAGTAKSFHTNPIRLFGRTCWVESDFTGHEVAWKGRCTEADAVFDSAFEVDGDDRPTKPPQRPLLPGNMTFGGLRDRKYLFRLLSPKDYPETIEAQPDTRQRRKIRPNPKEGSKRISLRLLESVKSHYRYSEWPPPSNATILTPESIKEFFLRRENFHEWRFLFGPDFIETANYPFLVQFLVLIRENPHPVRLDIDVCNSAQGARDLILQRLGHFQTATLDWRKDLEIGEITFVEPEVGAILFIRANLVILVRFAGNGAPDVSSAARYIDQLLSRFLEKQESESELLEST